MGRSEVLAVLAGSCGNRLVRGEIWVSPAVLRSQHLPNSAAGIAQLATTVGADFCFLSCDGPQAVASQPDALTGAVSTMHVQGLACGVVIDGPWQRLARTGGLLGLLGRLRSSCEELRQELAIQTGLVQQEISAWADAGADLMLLADDIAYAGGPYFSPGVFIDLLLPSYLQLLAGAINIGVPMGFHSDGDMTVLLPFLNGFSFLCPEPEAIDLGEKKGHRVSGAVLSGIRAAWLDPTCLGGIPESQISAEISSLASSGPLMLGSACGLFDPRSLTALREVYRIADRPPLQGDP